MRTGEGKPVSWTGQSDLVYAFVDSDLVFFCGLPTEGTPVKYMEHYSPLRGPRPLWSLKVAELSTGKFQTLEGHFDPRRDVSTYLRRGKAARNP